jgi:excisionase family DNA binding protein
MPSDADAAARSERSFLIDDAARLLGVSRRTVYYRIREGRLLTIRAKCGSQRVLLSSIEALMRGRQEDSQQGRQEDSQEDRQKGRQEGRQNENQEAGSAIERAAADVAPCKGERAGGSETEALPL